MKFCVSIGSVEFLIFCFVVRLKKGRKKYPSLRGRVTL